MIDFLESETGFQLLAWAVAVVWALIQGSKWWQERVAAKYGQAVTAIEAGVSETYAVYVEAIKKGRTDGKLTPDEREEARQMALRRAREILLDRGAKLDKIMPPREAAMWVERGVTALKQGRGTKA